MIHGKFSYFTKIILKSTEVTGENRKYVMEKFNGAILKICYGSQIPLTNHRKD